MKEKGYNKLYRKYVWFVKRGIAMSDVNERWVSLDGVAEYCGVTKDMIRNWIKKGSISADKIGRIWKFKFLEIDEWVESGGIAL